MQPVKELRSFFFSQQFADGLRITAAILLPAAVLFQFGLVAIGFAISLGAMCVSMTDAPGPVLHRRNGMLAAACLIFVVALLTSFLRANLYALGAGIVLFIFLFSLLQVYGMRAASVGNAAILVMILTMGQVGNTHPVLHAFYILAGGFWYTGFALFFYHIRPYRPAQRVLGDCIRAVADYLFIKALFYNVHTHLQENYKKMVAQQQAVHEKQDAVREYFFKTARIVNETTPTGRKLVAVFVHTVDLFEDITATYYNYSTLRNRFEASGILHPISFLITQLATELDSIGMAIQSNTRWTPTFDINAAIADLKKRIDQLKEKEPEENTLILKRILVNIRKMAQRINDITPYFDPAKTFSKSHVDHTVFIGHQPLDPKLLWNNLNFGSTAFKHALRISLASIVGFVISKLLAYGQHSYWILLTIAFILKPTFSLTKTRNVERILGTIAGGVLGVLILYFIKNTTAHFILMVGLMLGTYTFMRTRYLVMVICTTAYILILFQFLNIPFITVVQERVFDTVLGCAIAFAAGYFLFPDWEAEQIKKYMAQVLLANAAYLQKVTESLDGKPVDNVAYKLARKQVYVQSANLSAAYQRMAAEPKRRQHRTQLVHQFLVRNHLLFSNIANVAALLHDPACPYPDVSGTAKKAIHRLYGLSKKLDADAPVPDAENRDVKTVPHATEAKPADNALLQSGVAFVLKLCDDICKTTEAILSA